ncbi:MAG: alanine racemase, partial [Oscillospiraceae bacterium]
FYVVLKADAYGHGAKYLAKIYEELGAFGIAVSSFSEGMELRTSGIKLPILVLGYTDPTLARELFNNKISQCVFSFEYAEKLNQQALYPIDCHLKLDTGMGRLGFDVVGDKQASFSNMRKLLDLHNLKFTGIFSHFPVADALGAKEVAYTENQIKLFNETLDFLVRNGFDFKIIHGQNSAGILRNLGGRFNTMRAGIILYGENPSEEVGSGELQPTMTVRTIVTHLKTIKAGQFVGYGMCFEAVADTKIATIAIGYADGLPRQLKSSGHFVSINGREYPMVGICMDQCMVDVTGGGVELGDEVIVMGGYGNTSFGTISKKVGTISHQIMCGIQRRVPRVYIENGKVVNVECNM